ncbi:MAG: hypothetical protein PHU34_07655 [Candidatus Methanoperedens sp.]|nr:hypothetical protein [Candidatus Methanoperedens sp.]
MKFEYDLEYPKELDDPISEECYICGRSNDDLKTLINRNVIEINAQIKRCENALVELTAKYNKSIQEILESTKESNFLDVHIDTITEDLNTFRKKIPHLDEILSSVQEEHRGNLKNILKAYKNKMENNPDNSPAIAKINKRIADLNEQKLHLQDQEKKKKFEMPLLKRKIRFDGRFDSQLEVAICPVCSCLVELKGNDLTYIIQRR